MWRRPSSMRMSASRALVVASGRFVPSMRITSVIAMPRPARRKIGLSMRRSKESYT
ncbi:hypothetical protein K523DRAFT_94990 [Schizophyllum commune Tattone D]|nr:hypothetical protein K523DRAFT_94990 [Schizophyllum commune Tattone D]